MQEDEQEHVQEKWPRDFAKGERNRRAVAALTTLRGISPRRLLALAQTAGSATDCIAAAQRGQGVSDADRVQARTADPDEVFDAARACDARMVTPADQEYPAGLLDLADPPVAIFVRGRRLDELLPGISIVGARSSSPGGRDAAEAIAEGLARAGVTVVSGAARGIDASSHRGALSISGSTVAVLGCGVDVAYPSSSRQLLTRIAATGAIVSEYPPGILARPHHFPARNRLIAAFGLALVIVEGAEGSGSLITCEQAMEIGRQIFAVPGPVTSPLSAVPLGLLRDGAGLIRGADDLLQDMAGLCGPVARAPSILAPDEQRVLNALAGPTLPEAIASRVGRPIGETLGVLMQLELRGIVRSSGGRFERRIVA